MTCQEVLDDNWIELDAFRRWVCTDKIPSLIYMY
jgi:hypothetical protein